MDFAKGNKLKSSNPSLGVSVIPVAVLLCSLLVIIIGKGASSVIDYGYMVLLGSSVVCVGLSKLTTSRQNRLIVAGVLKSSRQILPTVPILLLIGTLSATWMLSGVVPTLIDYGIKILNPMLFLVLTCTICSVVSVVTGSSWTTIATIGVAFMGIGEVLGYSEGWIAGAIISGAYFGDKVSPLSDTTVLAASSTGVDLFSHIRFMMQTTVPAMLLSLGVFGIAGMMLHQETSLETNEMIDALGRNFNLTPWVLLIPLLTLVLIIMRKKTVAVLGIGTLAGLAGMFVFQSQIVEQLTESSGFAGNVVLSMKVLLTETQLSTGNALLDNLIGTGGVAGMLPTVYLVLSAMIFGGVMIGTGMLGRITGVIIAKLRSSKAIVGTTLGSGILLNCFTGDQYLSIIIGGNVYKNTYKRVGIKPLVLSRSLEDSISVTSVLIPWNSCGIAQSSVLGVATLTYLPYCVFNILSPVMSFVWVWIGRGLRYRSAAVVPQ